MTRARPSPAAPGWPRAQGRDCALSAAQAVLAGDRAAFALSRPPGHHAGVDFFGGYCFLNNAALAAQHLRDAGMQKVAVLDVDYHHGNGTQAIFYDRPDVFFASIHGDPRTEYPFYLGHADEKGQGAGLGANLNLPLPRGTDFATWAQALEKALAAHRNTLAPMRWWCLWGWTPLKATRFRAFTLKSDDYLRLGERLAQAGLPTVLVFEGGYAVDEVGMNAVNVLEAFG